MRAMCGPHADDPRQRVDVERDFTDVGWMQLWELSEVARELPRQLDHVLFVLCKPVTR
jgi:hypothetical protein